jgi:cytidylate kinase
MIWVRASVRRLWGDGGVIIAIDGPAGSGKGTLAQALGDRFGYAVLDTGLIYRAVGMKVLRDGANPSDVEAAVNAARHLRPDDVLDPNLRNEDAAAAASLISAFPSVRAELLEFQREFARHPPGNSAGAVLDGRDIGTNICPNAPVKFFITARPEVRADRRVQELRGWGHVVDADAVLADIKLRDERDIYRSVAPLRPADDAVILDTSNMTAEEVLTWALDYIKNRVRSG